MFAEFQRDDKKNRPEIDKLIEKKFDLLMEVEGHLIKNIKSNHNPNFFNIQQFFRNRKI